MTVKKEYTKKCELCKKKKQARLYRKPVNGKYIHLCRECWENQEVIK